MPVSATAAYLIVFYWITVGGANGPVDIQASQVIGGPHVVEEYGPVDDPIVVQRKLTLSYCQHNGMREAIKWASENLTPETIERGISIQCTTKWPDEV